MCGIAGVVQSNLGRSVGRSYVEQMVDAIAHRGPDSKGFFSDETAALGMSRLSIVDLTQGDQPIHNEDASISLVCNGEIYNQAALRTLLQEKRHKFRTNSDVEVIVHLYEEYGDDCVSHLEGMFAFALWDRTRQRLLLARDRLGIKPLFYSSTGDRLLFASEIQALKALHIVDEQIDWLALDDYFAFAYIPFPRTIFRGIRKLCPGHCMTWEKGRMRASSYWKLDSELQNNISEGDAVMRLRELLLSAVQSHLMSDVPVGAFLSGGVDSSLVVALMAQVADRPFHTFTVGFGGSKGGYLDERAYARNISRRFNTIHHELEVLPDLRELLPCIAQGFGEPFGDDSVIPSYLICQFARQHTKVALTGLGGDELFGGYERHLGLKLSYYYELLPKHIRGAVRAIAERVPERNDGHYTVNHIKRFVRGGSLGAWERYREYLSVFNEAERDALLTREARNEVQQAERERRQVPFNQHRERTLLDRALYHDLMTYLPEDVLALTDRLSMANSLELRVPYLDHRVVEFSATIPARLKIRGIEKKYLLRKVARELVPDEVFRHRKQGFASPLASWLRGDLKSYIEAELSAPKLEVFGILEPRYVAALLDQHHKRNSINDRKLFTVLMFQYWCEQASERAGIGQFASCN